MRLTIVVNMYNTAAYMPKCLDTLLHQDIPQGDYEIILVDDCSTDNSLELANEYARKVNGCTKTQINTACAAINIDKQDEVIKNAHSTSVSSDSPHGLECNQPQVLTSELAAPVIANAPNMPTDESHVECLQKNVDCINCEKNEKNNVASSDCEKKNQWHELIRVIHHEKNKGLAAARNTGIDAAKGEYLCFVDPDDYIEKNSLAALLKQMDDEQLDMLRFNYQKVDEQYNNVPDSEIEARFDYTPKIMSGTEFLAHRLGIGCYVWAYIYRLDFIRKTGIRFFEGCFFDDAPWLPRILQKAQRINVIPVRHQYYLQRSTSMVHARNKQAIIRRADMHMQMIDILLEQKCTAPKETYEWYDMMFAQAAISMLTSMATIDYTLSLDYYKRLREKKIFPLSTARASKKSIRKIKMLNKIPRLTLFFVYMRNR